MTTSSHNATSLSLLGRLKEAGPDSEHWRTLQKIYEPWIRRRLRKIPGMHNDADDLAQEVFLALVRELPRFEWRRTGSFRAWLRQIAINRARAHWKSRARHRTSQLPDETDFYLSQLEDPNGDLAKQWDKEHDKHVFDKLLAAVKPDFAAQTWRAFVKFALDGQPAAEVADELKISENAVLLAKSRILKRLREEAKGLLD